MSWYQELKLIFLELFGLSKDAIHIHVGFLCFAIFLLVFPRKINSWIILAPGFLLSFFMELLDLRDDYVFTGTLKFTASLHDLINTNLIPFILITIAKRKKISVG